jgi:hypothetical protein
VIVFLLVLILFAILFPGGARTLLGLFLAFLCFAIAAGIEPDSAPRDSKQIEQNR